MMGSFAVAIRANLRPRLTALRAKAWFRPVAITATVAALYFSGALQLIDYRLMDLAFKTAPRDASGAVVVVAIDPPSLQRIGVWPWPRRYHAQTVQRLLDAGASRVALALDLSSPTTASEDEALSAVLRRAGGRVVLPVFRQVDRGREGAVLVETTPLPGFESHPLLASANLVPSGDALVRSSKLWVEHADLELPTFAVALAAVPKTDTREFFIDYGIDPKSVPQLSYADVRDGSFAPQEVAGKAVIIGATAIELGANIPVPIYHTLPGALVQALAVESLVQGRAIQVANPLLVLAAVAALTLFLAPALRRVSWRAGLLIAMAAGTLVLASAWVLHYASGVFFAPAPLLVACILVYALTVLAQLDREARRVYLSAMAAAHKGALARRLIDHSLDAIFVVGRDGFIQSLNPAGERLFGYAERGVKGLSVSALLEAPDEAEFGFLRPGYPVMMSSAPREMIGRRRDGTRFPVEVCVTAVPLRSGRHKLERRRGERTVLICSARDITERKAAEAALRRAHREAEEASRAKTELIANMSHELRTPLNAIIGFAEMMEQRVLGDIGHPRYSDYAQEIGESGRRLLRIINDILDLSSLEARRFVLAEGEVDVAETLRGCIDQFDGEARGRGISMEIAIAPNLPKLWADQAALRQALCALVSNAVKFNRDGGSIALAARAAGEVLTVSISDSGIGMPPDQIDRLMEAFERVEGSLSRRFDGTGLGLPLARALLALHGAALTIASQPDRGTTASIVFGRERFVAPGESLSAPGSGSGTASSAQIAGY